jgi:hypothetical protein
MNREPSLDPEVVLIRNEMEELLADTSLDRPNFITPMYEHVETQTEQQLLHTFICTAVPYASDEQSETSSVSSWGATTTGQANVDTIVDANRFAVASATLGCVVGCFIQLSSLGANYILGSTFSHSVLAFSLAWSMVTSAMGVAMLLLVCGILQTVADDRHLLLLHHLECYFCIGTLVGVCICWTVTDRILGLDAHIWHSLVTLAAALVWCKAMMRYSHIKSARDVNDQCDLGKQLIGKQQSRACPSMFKRSTLSIGLLVGLYIQFSFLGANFLLSNLRVNPVWMLAWSFFTSSMGVSILLLLRTLLCIASSDQNNLEAIMVHLESFFAVGALIGLHLAWLVTDYLLGQPVPYVQSFIMLFVALVWCKLVSKCTQCRPEDVESHALSSLCVTDLSIGEPQGDARFVHQV